MEKREPCRLALLDRPCLVRAHTRDYSVACIGSLTCNDIDGEKEFKGESGEKMYA